MDRTLRISVICQILYVDTDIRVDYIYVVTFVINFDPIYVL